MENLQKAWASSEFGSRSWTVVWTSALCGVCSDCAMGHLGSEWQLMKGLLELPCVLFIT